MLTAIGFYVLGLPIEDSLYSIWKVFYCYKILEKQINMICGSSGPKTKTKPKKGFFVRGSA